MGDFDFSKASEYDILSRLATMFPTFDTNGNGFIEKGELSAIKGAKGSSVLQTMADRINELMFANVDKGGNGADAWHGLSQFDVNTLRDRSNKGQSIKQIGDNLRSQMIRDRGLDKKGGFDKHVAHHQKQSTLHPERYNKVQDAPAPAEVADAKVKKNPKKRGKGNEYDTIADLSKNFGKYDSDKDGFLSKGELQKVKGYKNNKALQDINGRRDELMFSNIDASAAAWHGLSNLDVNSMRDRSLKGESIGQMADGNRTQIIRDRGLDTKGGFDAHVAHHQTTSRANPALYAR